MTIETGTPKNITATGDVTAGNTQLLGFYVNSTSSGTLVLKRGGAGRAARRSAARSRRPSASIASRRMLWAGCTRRLPTRST